MISIFIKSNCFFLVIVHFIPQVFQEVWASIIGAESCYEYNNVPHDSFMRQSKTKQFNIEDARTSIYR